MVYQALYRKWRPKTFDDVVGQKHITETLKNQISTGRLSHAYLFIGTRGTGKTTCAKILAKAVNCENPENGNPCNKCRSCLGIDDGTVLDVVEMDAASNNGVDNVRALREEAIFSPASVKKRVYIIDEVHMLSGSAFNALLKILEEPPAHLMFILATTELNKVPATILSRCQRHSFKRLDMSSLTNRLQYVAQQEKLSLSSDAAALIARLSDGGMRDALSLLDQCSGNISIGVDEVYSSMGLAGKQSTIKLLQFISSANTASALLLFQQLWQDGKDPASLINELSGLMRDILIDKVAPKGGGELLSGGYDDETLNSFKKLLSAASLMDGISDIQNTLAAMKNGHAKTLCELCLIRLCEPAASSDNSALGRRLERLESAIYNGDAHITIPKVQPEVSEKPVTVEKNEAATPVEEIPFDLPAAPIPEPVPVPLPYVDPPVREQENAFVSDRTDSSWEAVTAALEGKLPVGIMAMLTDPMNVNCKFNEDTIQLSVTSDFARNNINRPDVLGIISETAAAVLGKHYRVDASGSHQTEAPAPDTKPVPERAKPGDKLDELNKFDIVVFK